jgi:hypothetical protein
MKADSPARQLAGFIGRYSPEVAKVARRALAKMRARMPGAVELVYDNYNALAIAWGATERRSDLICSIALYPRWVSLFFARGAELPDPDELLNGSGKTIRHIVLEDAKTLDRRPVRALLDEAIARADRPLPGKGRVRTVIRAVSTKQRPRRPPSTRAG